MTTIRRTSLAVLLAVAISPFSAAWAGEPSGEIHADAALTAQVDRMALPRLKARLKAYLALTGPTLAQKTAPAKAAAPTSTIVASAR